MRKKSLITATLLSCTFLYCNAQDSSAVLNKILGFPNKLFSRVNSKVTSLQGQIDKKTQKYLDKLERQEAKLKRHLLKYDSNAAKSLFATNPSLAYASYLQKMKSDTIASKAKSLSGEYYPYIDSLQGSISFLNKNPQLIDASKLAPSDIQSSLNNLKILQSKMQDASLLQEFIQQRKEQFKLYINRYTSIPPSIQNAYQGYNKTLFYYSEQIREYKETLNDPDKMTNLALKVLNKVPAFTKFIQQNSMLSSIFSMPGTSLTPSVPGQGMPTRDQVLAAFQGQLGSGAGPNASSLAQAGTASGIDQVDQLRAKISSYGSSGSADIDMPNFQPNNQKTKNFLKRFVYGIDMQTVHSTFFFPATTDLGLSLAYKVDSKNDIGIGASYKVGWGKDINHIRVSGQGMSVRSFVDINLKKSFFVTGGFEYNYQQPFNPGDFPSLQSWQQSGLLGLSKSISLKTKFLKSSKVQLLWDFLSYQQIPKAQPLKFRIGYNF